MQHAKKNVEEQNGDRVLGGETLGVQLSPDHQSIKLNDPGMTLALFFLPQLMR